MRYHVVREMQQARAAAWSLTWFACRNRVAYRFVFEKFLCRERRVPLVLAGRVILPTAPALTDAQKETALHAFKVRCVASCSLALYGLLPNARVILKGV